MHKKKSKKILPGENSFSVRIAAIIKDLYYISETDSEIFPFTGTEAVEVSADELLKQLGKPAPVEERDFEDFFKRLTELQEWFGDEEIATANKFSRLKELLMKNLKDVKVFKVGQIEVDIYIVGLDSKSILTGVWTKAVET